MIYLDNAATSWPKPPEVLRAVNGVMSRPFGNPGRGGHRASLCAGRVVYACREAAEAAGLPALQGEVLRHLSASVAPGGSICYCTCTWREAENSAVTHAFLAENKDFEMEQERTFWPDLDGTDGFYSCRMRRKSGI